MCDMGCYCYYHYYRENVRYGRILLNGNYEIIYILELNVGLEGRIEGNIIHKSHKYMLVIYTMLPSYTEVELISFSLSVLVALGGFSLFPIVHITLGIA